MPAQTVDTRPLFRGGGGGGGGGGGVWPGYEASYPFIGHSIKTLSVNGEHR